MDGKKFDSLSPILTDPVILLIAKTIFGEAEGEPVEGQIGGGGVIRNRALDPGKDWWGDTYEEVILKKGQFSCWTERTERLEKIDLFTDLAGRQCLWIAAGIYYQYIRDITGGANHYLAKWMLDKGVAPKWARQNKPIAAIKNHVFFKL